MSFIQDVRKAIANAAPEGVYAYSSTPGSPELPAMIVGLPENWNPSGTLRHKLVTFPVYVAVNGDIGNDYEGQLFDLTDRVVAALKTITRGENYQGLDIESISEFGLIPVGNAEVLSSKILINVFISNS